MKIITPDLIVWVAVSAWQKIRHWIGWAGDYEVSGLGLVDEIRDDDGDLVGYLVTDTFLPEQTNFRMKNPPRLKDLPLSGLPRTL